MPIQLPPLPYEKNALEPHISAETLEYHYHKHHAGYAVKLNALISDSYLEKKSLEDIIRTSSGNVLYNAAQVYNHNVYWRSMSPNGGGEPSGALAKRINLQWGSFSDFKASFNDNAMANSGSSWTWLIKDQDGTLNIINTSDAGTPITEENITPVLVVDLWEHAYYIDYRHRRAKYLEAFWALINWSFSEKNFAG